MLAGFSMGPVAGVLVVVFKCLLKFPLTSTAYVGELTDMLIGIAYVLPAAISPSSSTGISPSRFTPK